MTTLPIPIFWASWACVISRSASSIFICFAIAASSGLALSSFVISIHYVTQGEHVKCLCIHAVPKKFHRRLTCIHKVS